MPLPYRGRGESTYKRRFDVHAWLTLETLRQSVQYLNLCLRWKLLLSSRELELVQGVATHV